MPLTAPALGEEQPVLGCFPARGHEAVVPRPTEGSARLALKRKGLSCSKSSSEDCQAEAIARSPPPRFRSADHKLCRQVHAAVAGVLQQAVASKERAWKRRNFLGKRVSLGVPSPPRAMLRTCELNDFVCWAVDEVQDHDPDYLPLLHSTLHNLMLHGADPAPVGPQAALPSECSAAEPAPKSRSHCQPMVLADAQSLGGHDPRAGSTGQPTQLPQDIDALVNEEQAVLRALQARCSEEPPDFMVEEALSLASPPRTDSVDSASPCSSRHRRYRAVSSQSS